VHHPTREGLPGKGFTVKEKRESMRSIWTAHSVCINWVIPKKEKENRRRQKGTQKKRDYLAVCERKDPSTPQIFMGGEERRM